jgi:hypothetical protein
MSPPTLIVNGSAPICTDP